MTPKRILLGLAVPVLLLLLAAGYWAWDVSRPPRIPATLGNWPRILRSLENHPSDRPISFAIVGDTHNSQVFDDILRHLRSVDIDFIVNLGDVVQEPTVWDHWLFLEEMNEELRPGGPPMLMVAGNHDVDPQTFPLSSFEALYGPTTFSFQCGGNLFVVVCNAMQNMKKGWGWQTELEKTLRERRGTAQRIFVFMHKPPVLPRRAWKHAPTNPSVEFLNRLGVDYVFSGHLHRYGHTRIGRTEVLISGGGGGGLRGEFGRFHHTVVMRLNGDRVTEEILTVATRFALEEKLESYYLRRVFPWVRRVLNLPDPVLGEAGGR